MKRALIVHGGCDEGFLPQKEMELRTQGVRKAFEIGLDVLQGSDSALDAVESVIVTLEDDPHFDAGISGSFSNMIGEIEMDASIMDSNEAAGAVIRIKNFAHPISVARKVMEEIPHIILSGKGAEIFARLMGFRETSPDEQHANTDNREMEKLPENYREFVKKYSKLLAEQRLFSTVGAVAVDSKGRIVAGTSTGGIAHAFPGRVGDTPIIGAGTFASISAGASATGLGEGILRVGVTRKLVELIEGGQAVQKACDRVIEICSKRGSPCGVIALDDEGNAGISHNGFFMPTMYSRFD
ncbi:isoaspartyl peptidase/L-asparaginase family protein [Mesotoga sp. UBA5557]|uniref:isoaspartyl peptidase/L-asparaginase family protein n=1 Tax=Mesotoga sp. UBA5557 TaxID=1946857 RepID=UPI0025EE1A35|nr:isoaspartyl peptidase/L-asparaginase [Mesotoga sp. UBA5557]